MIGQVLICSYNECWFSILNNLTVHHKILNNLTCKHSRKQRLRGMGMATFHLCTGHDMMPTNVQNFASYCV